MHIRVPAQLLCLPHTPAQILSPLTHPQAPVSPHGLDWCLPPICNAHTLIPQAPHTRKCTWTYQHGSSTHLLTWTRPKAPPAHASCSWRFALEYAHTLHAHLVWGRCRSSAPTQQLAAGTWAVTHGPAPAPGAEPLAQLTHSSPPRRWILGHTHSYHPSGWGMKTPHSLQLQTPRAGVAYTLGLTPVTSTIRISLIHLQVS